MTEYPMDFGTGYKVQTVYANKAENGSYGDIYDFRRDVEQEHPGAEILTGYCVISVETGFVAEGCNDWNNTIAEAILDYENHVVPDLQREEPFELSCPVCDEDDKLLYNVEFTVKTGWLEDYFDLDNYCQLEALWDISEAFDDDEIFRDALKEAGFSDLHINSLIRDNVKVCWTSLGEGLHGDYDPMDPEDVELLRFDVFVQRDGAWEEKEDASYCTNFPSSATAEEKLAGLLILLNRFHEALSPDIDVSVKKLGEQLSWIDPGIVAEHIKPLGSPYPAQSEPDKPNAADSLIKAMVAYGLENNWCDGEIIEALTDLGITYDDFCHAGAQDFIKGHLEPSIQKTPLADRIQSASETAKAQSTDNVVFLEPDKGR